MARSTSGSGDSGSDDISIIGPQMKVVGDLLTDGTVRVEGRIEGNVEAGKAVVVGKEGEVHGDVRTQDAVVSGRVRGTLTAASRLEVQASARIDGEVHARRLQLEEGGMLNGTVRMGEVEMGVSSGRGSADEPSGSRPAGDAKARAASDVEANN